MLFGTIRAHQPFVHVEFTKMSYERQVVCLVGEAVLFQLIIDSID